MSRHHSKTSNSVRSILRDIEFMSHDDIRDTYGIEINDDGSVYDPVDRQEFNGLADWAQAQFEADEQDVFEQFGGKYDDEDDW